MVTFGGVLPFTEPEGDGASGWSLNAPPGFAAVLGGVNVGAYTGVGERRSPLWYPGAMGVGVAVRDDSNGDLGGGGRGEGGFGGGIGASSSFPGEEWKAGLAMS